MRRPSASDRSHTIPAQLPAVIESATNRTHMRIIQPVNHHATLPVRLRLLSHPDRGSVLQAIPADYHFRATAALLACIDFTRAADDAPSSDSPYPTSRTMRSFKGWMKCTRVLRRVTSGAFKYNSANSRARLSAVPFATTSATTPHSCAVRADSGCGFSRNASAHPAPAR